MADEKTQEERKQQLERDQEEAKKQLETILKTTRPKNFRQGLAHGVGNIVGGAVGGVGIAVLAPVIGGAAGLQGGGIIGGALGLTGGAVVGALGAVGMVVAGAVTGTVQVARGVVAVPEAVMAPSKGKWWNDVEHQWVYTDLPAEAKGLEVIPEDDSDLIGEVEKEVDLNASTVGGEVKDPYYYDVLEVDPKAEPSAIKRKYYLLARKYHPDRLDKDDKEGAEKFKEIAEAYQVLSDPELRAKYDRDGRGGLSADKTEVADNVPKVDPVILFAFLFGSDKFNDYVGRLATATSALVGDSPKISVETARTIQKRRVTRLAVKMAAKLQPWVEEDYENCKTKWKAEAEDLSTASFGSELVHTIGKIYSLAAIQYIASIDDGVGLPSISKWATKQKAKMEQSRDARKNQVGTMRAGMEAMKIQQKFEKELAEAKTDEEKEAVKAKMEDEMGTSMLKILWTLTVVDITNTLHETAQLVFNDQSVSRETRQRRGHALKALGEIFMECPTPEDASGPDADAKQLYEDAAFAAMLETIKRKEEAAQAASCSK